MLKQKKFIILFIVAATIMVVPVFVEARGLVPCGGPGEHACNVQDVFYLFARVTNWLISLAGVYAVFQIINAGFWLVASMGNEENITKWRKGLSNAVVGFVVVLLAYVLMNTAVNMLLANGVDCKKVNLSNPLTYVKLDPGNCMQK